jgi:hypothetical protein
MGTLAELYPRGKIHDRERRQQIVSFEGLRYGNITPTDLDGLIDYKNERFAFFELKIEGVEMQRGQGLALVRVVDLIQQAGKKAALFVAWHSVFNTREDIDAANTYVHTIYTEGQMIKPISMPTLRAAVDKFLGWAPQNYSREPGEEG